MASALLGNSEEDMRFTLTPWERESAKRLKAECDSHGVEYNSIFELVKYVLVVKTSVEGHNEKDEQKRTSLAFNRIKARREWEKKVGVDKIDPFEALLEAEKLSPGFLIHRYEKDDEERVVLAFSKLHVCPKRVLKKKPLHFAALLHWYDLAAADLAEARRGVTVVSMVREEDEKHVTLQHSLSYYRALFALKDLLKPIHNVRVKRVLITAPGLMRSFSNMIVTKLLPCKVASRVRLFGSQTEIDNVLHPCLNETMSLHDWVAHRSAIYNETLKKLNL